MKLKSFFLVVLALLMTAGSTQAKTDVTAKYLKNANLTSLEGWSYGDGGYNYTDWKTDGDVPVIEFYHTWSNNAGAAIGSTRNFHFTQDIKLPAGHYHLSVNAFYREGNGNGTNTKAYIFAGDKKQYIAGLSASGVAAYSGNDDLHKAANAFAKGDFSNEFDFELSSEQTITIGFRGYIDTYCSWCILGPVTLYEYTEEDLADDAQKAGRDAMVKALERFERNYNLTDGTDYSRLTMSADAWSALIEQVNAVSLAIDDPTRGDEYADLATALNAKMDATDQSLRLFRSYKAMSEGTGALVGHNLVSDYITDSNMDSDDAELQAIDALNDVFIDYARQQTSDFNMGAFLGANLDFNTISNAPLVTHEGMTINDIDGWTVDYADLDGWCFIDNGNDSYKNQLYLRCNWTDQPVRLQVSKAAMLPVGNYHLSCRWNSSLQNLTNLSSYRLGETTSTIGKATSSYQTLTYELNIPDRPTDLDLTFGFQKRGSGNAPAQILVDDITLTYDVAGSNIYTAISECPDSQSVPAVYDLQGRRVDAKTADEVRNLKKGIYVIQGKIIIR